MGIINEYLHLIPNALKNADKITESIINHVKNKYDLLSKEEQDEIIRRRFICATCPFNSKNATENGWYKSERIDDHCTQCGCNLELKTECLTCNCGNEAYNQSHPKETPLELKWTVFNKNQ